MSWVFLSGQIRNAETAHVQALQLERMRGLGLIDGIVFSTWRGEFERYPDVLATYKALGAILVESPEPNLRMPGYILHQALCWVYALQHVPAGAKVLRMRPDIAPLNEAFDGILRDSWVDQTGGLDLKPTAYRNRIWCHSGLVTWPFFLNDVFFYGYKEDVYRLCNADVKLEWVFSELATEQFFHLGPVANVNPVIELYGRLQRGKHAPERNAELKVILWESDFWYDVLYNMAKELLANYHIGFVPPSIVYNEDRLKAFEAFSITDLLSGDVPIPDFISRPEYGGNSFNSLTWAQALLTGRFKRDRYMDRFVARQQATLDDVRIAASGYQSRIAAAFHDYQPVIDVPHPDVTLNTPHQARIQMAEQSSYVQSMEAEINLMRRQLEAALLSRPAPQA